MTRRRTLFDGGVMAHHNPAMNGPPRLFDRALLDRRRIRALAEATDGAEFLLVAVADDLVERLGAVQRQFALAADIGSPLPLVAERLAASGRVERIVRLDRLAATRPDVVADQEALPLAAASIDLAVSALALHWADDMPGVLAQIRMALKPDGLFLGALLGGETLTELRQALAEAEAEVRGGAAPRVSPFAEVRALGALLQRAGFALPVIDQDRRTVRYDSALHLMRDLRAMGATNALVERDRRPLPRAVLVRAAAIYAERFSDPDGRVRATFDVISLSGWAPHESQQKPLKPGSAKARLADALRTVEKPAGDKAG
jgi:SAM-dependent methyltransferase